MAKIKKLPLLAELEALEESVFSDQIGWDIPDYIRQNMVHTFRNYQDQALRFFHYTRASDRFRLRNIDHVLFNMATGSGKTDLMAALILYLYQEHDYQNFLFLVNTNSVLSKTVDNLITVVSDKYLYRHPIEVEGERVEIRKVNSFPRSQSKNTIYLKLATVQSVSSDIYTQKENSMATKDYGLHKVVVLGDEAHHYSASTKSEREAEQSWEQAISKILEAHEENLLLEFTATIDLENRNVYEKYKDKIVYRYTLDRFIQDGYSKNVKRIQSSNTDLDNMLNVVLLSEYRRRYALEVHDTFVKPVVMFKSQTIDASNEANNRFNQLVDSLTEESLGDFLDRQVQIATADNSETLALAHAYFRAREADWPEIIRDIKREFAPSRIINANDSDRSNMLEKGQYEALNSLESLSNLYRVVFAVAKLTEGWDVLNLFDIVRLSDHPTVSGTKAKTISEAQLIGRGARYFPFLLNGQRSYTRRFSDDSEDSMILETLHYHTINEPQYLKNLVAALDEMNLPTGVDKRNPLIDVKIKKDFRRTNVWQKGKVYYNGTVEVSDDYFDSLEKYGVDNKSDVVIPHISALKEVTYREREVQPDSSRVHNVPLSFDRRHLYKVMNRVTFYHFCNMKRYIPQLKSRDEFLGEKWLNIFSRTIYASIPQSMKASSITSREKLTILERYFLEVSKQIKLGYSKQRGTATFVGYPIREYIVNYRKRIPNYDTALALYGRSPQNVQRYEIHDPHYVYDSAIVNITEKQLIDRILERAQELHEKHDDVFLIRMDEHMHRESVKSQELTLHQFGQGHNSIVLGGFKPDFILYLGNLDQVIQIFVESKRPNDEKEQWKEKLLQYINEHEAEITFEDETEDVRIKGVRFYTLNDGRDTIHQIGEIALGRSFKGLSIEEEAPPRTHKGLFDK